MAHKEISKKVLFTIFMVFIILIGFAGVGTASYFAVLYIQREQNHRFESAYIYDTSFNKSVDVDLGVLIPDEEKEQEFMVKSLIVRDIGVSISFSGEHTNLTNYLCVKYENNQYLLADLIQNDTFFEFVLSKNEERMVKFTYYFNEDYVYTGKEEVNFSLNIQAYEISVYDSEW